MKTYDDLINELRQACSCVGENRAQDGDELCLFCDARLQIESQSELLLEAARYRHLRDRAGNQIMRKLMEESRPNEWDKLVDIDRDHADRPRGAQTVTGDE